MDMLALGVGVGFNIQRKHVNKLPQVLDWFEEPTRFDDGGADYIVPDSREGWVKLLGKTLKAAFLSDSEEKGTFTYSTQVIRGKGEPIKGFGGTASGPNDLCKGIKQISGILSKRRGKFLRPIDCLDIMCTIAQIIVAGNVRRSALAAIGDPDDVEFLLAKRWDLGNIPAWRAFSNNSVVCSDINDLHEFFWDGYEGKGEPYGLVNLKLSREIGRLGESQYKDPGVEGYNPCFEQALNPWETCCLAENFLPNFKSKEEFLDALELEYRVCKHSLLLPSHQPETEDIVQKNMRMGIGISGIQQATEEQMSWLDAGYKYLREFDKQYSLANGFPTSIKLTTVKPSGTLSLLPGVTPGIHPAIAKYLIRRVQIDADHILVNVCKEHGYPVEHRLNIDGSVDYSTVVVSFPLSYSEGTTLAEDMTAIDQLNEIRKLQTIWSDNSVSCTIYYTLEELPEIKRYLKKYYKNCHKTLSFLLKKDNGFKQLPYEEITKDEYEKLAKSIKPITEIHSISFDEDDSDCATGACPVR